MKSLHEFDCHDTATSGLIARSSPAGSKKLLTNSQPIETIRRMMPTSILRKPESLQPVSIPVVRLNDRANAAFAGSKWARVHASVPRMAVKSDGNR